MSIHPALIGPWVAVVIDMDDMPITEPAGLDPRQWQAIVVIRESARREAVEAMRSGTYNPISIHDMLAVHERGEMAHRGALAAKWEQLKALADLVNTEAGQ